MRQIKFAVAIAAAAILAACGGSGAGDQSVKVKYSSVVSFGDSLSDLGTYSVGTVKALGGGKYSVNGPTSKNWIELLAAQLGQAAPCSAQTGLDGLASQGFSVPVTNVAGCTAYGQGGARVTNPVGPGNKLLGGANTILGQLTVPVVTQIQTHLTRNGGAFKGDEIVFVLAGGNDVFINLATVGAGGSPTAAVTAMGTAGAELAAYVKTLIVAKGAKYVTVVNLPDVSQTPFGLSTPVATQGLINTMVTTFNTQLQQGLNGTDNVLYVDAYTVSRDQFANPAQFGISNITLPACDLAPAKNALGSSLVCNATNLIPGVTDKYQYADSVHPTPYGYQLLAQLVAKELAKRGWL
ncbi:MAG: SGNH/GDSL hydrolase family protein [Herminiimonas sp.]|nr:SGNH/GDSL hydrolase family protein [Herminiimonas sp.]